MQFGFAVVLIISTIVVSSQIRFVQNRDAGYAKGYISFINISRVIQEKTMLPTKMNSFNRVLRNR